MRGKIKIGIELEISYSDTMLNYWLFQKFKLLENCEFNYITTILRRSFVFKTSQPIRKVGIYAVVYVIDFLYWFSKRGSWMTLIRWKWNMDNLSLGIVGRCSLSVTFYVYLGISMARLVACVQCFMNIVLEDDDDETKVQIKVRQCSKLLSANLCSHLYVLARLVSLLCS